MGYFRKCHSTTLLVSCALVVATVVGVIPVTGGAAASAGNAASKLLGPEKKATKTPLAVGFSTDGTSQAIDFSVVVPTGQATARYVNNHLAGLGGHPLQLDTCNTQGTVAGAAICVNQWIADKVPIVLIPESGVADQLAQGLAAANILAFQYGAVSSTALTAPTSYVLTNTLSIAFGAQARYGQEHHYKRSAEILINVPSALQEQESIGGGIFKAAGISFDVEPVAPGTPDMTPQAAAVMAKKPQMINITGDAPFCISALKALRTLGYKGTIFVIPNCVTPTVAKSVSGGLAGILEATSSSTDPAEKEVQLYSAVMEQYAPQIDRTNSLTQAAWTLTLAFARAMRSYHGNGTPASIRATFNTMTPQIVPLTGGITFQCNRKQISISPATCSAGAVLVTLNSAGVVVKAQAVNANAIMKRYGQASHL